MCSNEKFNILLHSYKILLWIAMYCIYIFMKCYMKSNFLEGLLAFIIHQAQVNGKKMMHHIHPHWKYCWIQERMKKNGNLHTRAKMVIHRPIHSAEIAEKKINELVKKKMLFSTVFFRISFLLNFSNNIRAVFHVVAINCTLCQTLTYICIRSHCVTTKEYECLKNVFIEIFFSVEKAFLFFSA